MRVTFVQFVNEYGGLQRCLLEFATSLSKHAQVSIVDPGTVCTEFALAAEAAGLDYHNLAASEGFPHMKTGSGLLGAGLRIARNLPRILSVRNWMVREVQRIQPDVMCSFDLRSAMFIGSSRALRSIPLVVQLHGWYVPPYITAYGRWLMKHRASLVLAISHQTRTAVRCAGVDPANILVLQNPIDVDAMLRDADRPLAGELPGQNAAIRMVLPGQLSRGKGQGVAVEALAKLVERGQDAVLWLAGRPAEGEEAYIEGVKRMAQQRGVAARVAWLGLRNDLPQIMRRATVVVLPTLTEGHPRVVLEAMALGKPMVATPVGGVLDMILPELTGMLFEVGDAEGLSQCIQKLAADPALAERVGSLGQLHARLNFNPQRHTRMFLEALEQAVRITNRCGQAGQDRRP